MNEIHEKISEKKKRTIHKKWYVLIISVVILIILYSIPIFRPVHLRHNRFCPYDVLLEGFHAEVGDYYPSKEGIETVKIPSVLYGRPVTEVMMETWQYYTVGTAVYLPDTVKVVGSYAFRKNKIVEEVYAKNVEMVGKWAFAEMEKLHTVELGNHLESINHKAFYECKNLLHFDFPNSLSQIGRGAFRDSGVENIPENREVLLWEDAFYDTPWEENNEETFVILDYYYEKDDRTKKTLLRYNGKEKTVVIPEGVGVIGGAKILEDKCRYPVNEVFLPNTVTLLRGNIFEGQEHVTIYMPDSVESIWGDYSCIGKIITIEGSHAESYAEKNKVPVESLSEEEFWSRYPESAQPESSNP